jgi:hypothetical protein
MKSVSPSLENLQKFRFQKKFNKDIEMSWDMLYQQDKLVRQDKLDRSLSLAIAKCIFDGIFS